MNHKITLIPGDGTGPEIISAVKRCIDATGVKIEWEEVEGKICEETLNSIRKNKVALKGPITTPIGGGFRSINVALRHELGLYTCLRPCKSYPGINSHYQNIDIVIIRENSEDLYAGIEFEQGKEETKELLKWIEEKIGKKLDASSALGIKPISKIASERIVEFAFKYAIENKRKKISCVHKANIMKFTDGLFLKTAREVAGKYKEIEFEEVIVDNLTMQLVTKPNNFDVLVLPNLYGDIVSDLCAGLVGGLGVAPGANIGDGIAVFEPTHGSAPKYTNQNKVNPSATLLSGIMMLRYIGEDEIALKLENAWKEVVREGKYVTYDMKKDRNDPTAVGTSEMIDAIIKKL